MLSCGWVEENNAGGGGDCGVMCPMVIEILTSLL